MIHEFKKQHNQVIERHQAFVHPEFAFQYGMGTSHGRETDLSTTFTMNHHQGTL